MRIRRNLVPASNNSSNDVVSTCSDPPSNNPVVIPRRCSSTPSSLVCFLNQSPWDVVDPSSQLECGLFSLTGTSIVPDPSNAPRSAVASRKQLNRVNGADSDCDKERRENGARLKLSTGKIRAAKVRGGMIISSNKSQIRSSSSQPHPKKQQQPDPQPAPKRRGRPVKKPAANPYEFYYYSGFGPHWGKKRGNTSEPPPPPPGMNLVGAEELSSEASPSPSAAEDARGKGIEFVEYDDEDDEDEEGRRRGGRKRVKARSLKSLM
uniref:Uncharacterized protein n=1 Tax=Kalanchoe fedtschenkoi TaxID=63787 RepID=A0A7N0T4Q0_KALFE